MNAEIDVRDMLASIRVPTLVIHRTRRHVRQTRGRALSRREASAGPGWSSSRAAIIAIWAGDIDRVADEIEEFLTGARPRPRQDGCC